MDTLYAEESILQVLLVTGILGGGAAALAGRAIAQTWRPFWHVLLYMAMLGAAVRFVHFALFDGTLLSPASYIADTLYLIVMGSLAWRTTRAAQMATQYYWLYERTSPLTWRPRPAGGKISVGTGLPPGDPAPENGQNDAYPLLAAGATIRSEVRNLRRTL